MVASQTKKKKEFFSMKNAEEKRNMPWPKLKKPMKHEYHGLKVHCPSSLKTTHCLAAWQFMQPGQDILRLLFPKTMTSFEHPVENVCERAVLKQTAFKSHLWGLKATNSVNQRPEHCSGSYKRPEINAIYSFPEDLKACEKDLEKNISNIAISPEKVSPGPILSLLPTQRLWSPLP